MPIDIRLTAIPAPAGVSLAAQLAAVSGAAGDTADIAVAVQGAETAGLDSYLGSPVADVLAAAVLGQPAGVVRAFAEGLLLGSYRFSLASRAASGGPSEVRLLVPEGDQQAAQAVSAARTVAEAVGLARDLANMPSGRKPRPGGRGGDRGRGGKWADRAGPRAGRAGVRGLRWHPRGGRGLRAAAVPHRTRAGSIDAALFLREFTGGRPWAHLDIAGAARGTPGSGDVKGATGFGTRLLLAWLGGLSSA